MCPKRTRACKSGLLMTHDVTEYATSSKNTKQEMASNISSISQALAGNLGSSKVPKPMSLAYANVAHGAYQYDAMRAANKAGTTGGLPTPPNSISPTLPEAFKAKLGQLGPGAPPSIDSDIDLQDGSEHSNDKSEEEGDTADTAHISPQYLAKNHIADYVLEKGPIAVRHVMNHLSATVPGYNKIPAPKARRITVAALEGKNGGGPDGDVEFEKVGWGRWDAKPRGQPSRETRAMYSIHEDKTLPPLEGASEHEPARALQIPGSGAGRDRRRSKSRRMSYGSWAGESSVAQSVRGAYDEDELEDAMSIDEDEEKPSYRHMSRRRSSKLELSSDTEEEDWSTIGANSYSEKVSTSGPGRSIGGFGASAPGRSRSRGWSPYPNSLPNNHQSHTYSHTNHDRNGGRHAPMLDFTGMDMDPQERDAIKALLKMGSMWIRK